MPAGRGPSWEPTSWEVYCPTSINTSSCDKPASWEMLLLQICFIRDHGVPLFVKHLSKYIIPDTPVCQKRCFLTVMIL